MEYKLDKIIELLENGWFLGYLVFTAYSLMFLYQLAKIRAALERLSPPPKEEKDGQ